MSSYVCERMYTLINGNVITYILRPVYEKK